MIGLFFATVLFITMPGSSIVSTGLEPEAGAEVRDRGFNGNHYEISGTLDMGVTRGSPSKHGVRQPVASGLSSSAPQVATTRVEYRPGCYESLVRAECDLEAARIREQCVDEFVATHYTTLTFDLASGELVSSVYAPGYCPSDPETDAVTPQQIVVTAQDFQSLPLKGSGVFINPDETQVENYFVKLPINFYSDGSPQTLTTEVLGTQVLVEATPVVFQWDLGNGDVSPRVRDGRWVTHQGQRTQWFGWHQYTYVKSGFYTPSLTTQWSGRFSVDGGGSWRDIAGYAQTVESLPEVAVAESIPLLVRDSDAVWHKKTNP